MIDKNKTILILGGYGKCGYSLVDQLDKAGYTNLLVPLSKTCDLLDNYSAEMYFRQHKPDYVISLAAKTTNISLCESNPVGICRDTIQMNINLFDLCRKYNVEKVVHIICSCSYPGNKEILIEDQFWDGSPHQSVLAHGEAKRVVYFLAQSYNKQFKTNIVTVALNNVFGGNINWAKASSLKFLDSLIKKVVDAKLDKQKIIYPWGNGLVFRESIYAPDAAEGIIQVMEKYNDSEVINIGTGRYYNIRKWLEMICEIVKYKGLIEWQKDKPSGQYKKTFSVEKMRSLLNWEPPTDDMEAIKQTVENYKEYLKNVQCR